MGVREREWLGSMSAEEKAEYMYMYLVLSDYFMNEVEEHLGATEPKACSTIHRYAGFGGKNRGIFGGGYKGRSVTKGDFVAFLTLYPKGLPQEQIIVNNQENKGDVFRAFLDERHEILRQEEEKRRIEEEQIRAEQEAQSKREKAAQAKREKAAQAEREKAVQAEREKVAALQQQQKTASSPAENYVQPETPKTSKGSVLPMVVGAGVLGYLLLNLLF